MPPLMNHRYFAESTQSWVIEAASANGGRADSMETEAVLLEHLSNVEYCFDVSTYITYELKVNKCRLKCTQGILQ